METSIPFCVQIRWVARDTVSCILTKAYVTGPPQPSMVFRYLRMLEGVSPPLSLTQTACQATAKAFIVTRDDLLQATIYCCLPSPPNSVRSNVLTWCSRGWYGRWNCELTEYCDSGSRIGKWAQASFSLLCFEVRSPNAPTSAFWGCILKIQIN